MSSPYGSPCGSSHEMSAEVLRNPLEDSPRTAPHSTCTSPQSQPTRMHTQATLMPSDSWEQRSISFFADDPDATNAGDCCPKRQNSSSYKPMKSRMADNGIRAWRVILVAASMSAVLTAAVLYPERQSRIEMHYNLQNLLRAEIDRHSVNMDKLDRLESKLEMALESRVKEHDELAQELKVLRVDFLSDLDIVRKILDIESGERKATQQSLINTIHGMHDNVEDVKPSARPSCKNAVVGDECYKHVLWAKEVDIEDHPKLYLPLSKSANFKAFQALMYARNRGNCNKPCPNGGDQESV